MIFAWSNWRLSLAAKFILLSSVLVLATSLTFGFIVLRDQTAAEHDALLRHGRSAAAMIAQNSEYGVYTEDGRALQTIIESIANDPDIAYLFILNRDGRVLQYRVAYASQLDLPEIYRSWREGGLSAGIRHASFVNQEDGKEYIDILAPVVSEPKKDVIGDALPGGPGQGPKGIGYVHLGLTLEGLQRRVRQFILSMVLVTTLLVAAGITITILITRRIVSPVRELHRATQEIAEGRLDQRIEIRTTDEIADLARAFNDMLVRLQDSHDTVEQHTAGLIVAVERMRKEITERERTEAALMESEMKYRTLFEESRDVIFICSTEPRFLDVNRTGLSLLGYSNKQELLGLDLGRDLYDDPEEPVRIQMRLQEQGYIKDHEAVLKRKDGERLTMLMSAEAVCDRWGFMTSYRGVYHDMTDKRRLEQQLLQSQKMDAIGQLAGGIAHDFNNMLTAIIGHGSLLLMDMGAGSPLRTSVEHILATSERAANLTRSLLAFSRKQVISPKPADLNDIVRTIEKLLNRIIGEDIMLRTGLADRKVMVMADSGQIEQALINLCTNARDAMPEGGGIHIQTAVQVLDEQAANALLLEQAGSYAEITVADTGMGMDERTRARIFEPFFTTKPLGKGTGLGLSIVYGIIEQHGGTIRVQSTPGQGTSFSLYFPLIGDEVQVRDERKLPPPQGGTETILLAEDDADVRRLLSSLLRGSGYRVVEAVDGEDALSIFERNGVGFHLLLLDVIMPHKNGKEVYDAIRSRQPEIKALFMSGYTADIIDQKGDLDEGLHFIPKPVSPYELLRKVRTVLDAAR